MEEKLLSEFYKSRNRYSTKCKLCTAKLRRTPEQRLKKQSYNYKSRYGLSLSDFYIMKERFGNKCQICGTESRLVLDHNHETNEIRGCLCHHCNSLLGFCFDSIDILYAAIAYLQNTHFSTTLRSDVLTKVA